MYHRGAQTVVSCARLPKGRTGKVLRAERQRGMVSIIPCTSPPAPPGDPLTTGSKDEKGCDEGGKVLEQERVSGTKVFP